MCFIKQIRNSYYHHKQQHLSTSEYKQEVDLLFLDPASWPADVEFAEVEEFCRPLHWVVVNNANLPELIV